MPHRRLRVPRPASAAIGFAMLGAMCALIAACTSSVGGTGTLAKTPAASTTAHTTATNTRASSPDFPSTSASRATSAPTSTSPTRSPSGADSALKASLAQIGANWMHAYANGDEAQFCALSDPRTLQSVFTEKGIGSCAELNINWDSDPDLQSQLASFTIPDPQKISVSGSKATVSASNVKPAGLTSMSWIQQADQSWKVDASILAS